MASVKISSLVAKTFQAVWRDVKAHKHTHYWLKGGRGSTKSSFISIAIVLLIVMFPWANAVIIRKVHATMQDTVYNQMLWAVSELGLSSFFRAYKSPMELVYLPTGQRICFRGLDDPTKLKSTKFVKGYCAIVWFEELDQFSTLDEVRSAINSLRRGGDKFWIFYSYNPPRTPWSWVNTEVLRMEQRDDALVHHSTYLDIVNDGHVDWIGQPFVDEAEWTKELNPMQYEWEYLGAVTGTGGSVFENLTNRTITDEEIESFDNPRFGVDFGWFPDPWRLVQCEFQVAQRRLIIFGERSANKKTNAQTAQIILEAQNYAGKYHDDPIWCDSADNTAIGTYKREYGINARPASKGGLRKESYIWLSGLREIVIDPRRCPLTFEEFKLCEYAKDRDGNWVEDFNDGHDHSIDAVRYAVMRDVIRDR